ncbi:hypothetical protein AMC85_CH04046 [Rhizobium phaseoli]|nr:hypothetical protein AMC88_CH04049 [Rhizobium phaseoli]ANL61368.1 hypothetical protein AMC85_CH04046 [Rhizobium phaseoli]
MTFVVDPCGVEGQIENQSISRGLVATACLLAAQGKTGSGQERERDDKSACFRKVLHFIPVNGATRVVSVFSSHG